MGEMSFAGPVGWVGGWGCQSALYKYNMADWATHHTHKQNSHCEGKQKKRKWGVRVYLERGGKRGTFSSVQCINHCVEWLPGTEAEFLHL